MLTEKKIVQVSDAKVSNSTNDVLITYSLGSCIAVCLYDPVARAGGMLHYQLPDSKMDAGRAAVKPLMFADTGMKYLINQLNALGAEKKRMKVTIAGGANTPNGPKGFDIGKRNHIAIRKILWTNGMFIDAEDVGGELPRNMYLYIANGEVTVKSQGLEKVL